MKWHLFLWCLFEGRSIVWHKEYKEFNAGCRRFSLFAAFLISPVLSLYCLARLASVGSLALSPLAETCQSIPCNCQPPRQSSLPTTKGPHLLSKQRVCRTLQWAFGQLMEHPQHVFGVVEGRWALSTTYRDWVWQRIVGLGKYTSPRRISSESHSNFNDLIHSFNNSLAK